MPAYDTAAARDVLLHFLRGIAPSARVALACELSVEVVSLSADGMRYRQRA